MSQYLPPLTSPLDSDYEVKREKGLRLNKSLPFDLALWSDAEEVEALIDKLHKEVLAHTKPGRVHKDKDRAHLRVIVLNLFQAHIRHPELVLGYSRRKKTYKARSRYNPSEITFKLSALLSVLEALGYVETVKGYHTDIPGKSRSSRVWPTPSLLSLMCDTYKLTEEMVLRHCSEELIELRSEKDEHGRADKLEYEDTPETSTMRENLRYINQVIAKADIRLNVSDEVIARIQERLLKKDKRQDRLPVDFNRKKMRRVFNDCVFDRGGRFYGGWWQSIPSEYRNDIVINGIRTVEVDYSAIHPRILYAREGLQPPVDAYVVSGCSPKLRKAIKIALLIMLNAKDRRTALYALRNEIDEGMLMGLEGKWDNLVALIEATHDPIKQHFFSGIGTSLQYLDSQVAEAVMIRLAKKGYPILPVHDSFVVVEFLQFELEKAMREEFEAKLGVTGIVEAKNERFWPGMLDCLQIQFKGRGE